MIINGLLEMSLNRLEKQLKKGILIIILTIELKYRSF